MDGTKPYFTATHTDKTVASMHDHSDLIRTPGMGELVVVLNGVEFRTRHNDYKLKMPSTTSGDYHDTEDIPFPDVPPEVSSQSNVDMQVCASGNGCQFCFLCPSVHLHVHLFPNLPLYIPADSSADYSIKPALCYSTLFKDRYAFFSLLLL